MNLQPTTRIADLFVEPHATITNADQRRKARVLAALMLTLAGSALFLMAVLSIRNIEIAQASAPAVLVGVSVVLLLYISNRFGYYQVSAYGFIALNFVMLHSIPVFTGNVGWLLFTPMMMIFTLILLPLQATLVVYLLSIAVQTILGSTGIINLPAPELTTFTSVVVLLLTGAIMVIAAHFRDNLDRDLRAEIEELQQKLCAAETEIDRRVEERTRDLRSAKEQAEFELARVRQHEQKKMQALSSLSHQLRTPLNSMLNFTEFVHLEMLGPISEQQKDALGKSLDSSRVLLGLINNVLDIIKIEAGTMRLFAEPQVDLNALLPEVVTTTQALLHDRPNIEFVTDLDENLPAVAGDARRLSQTLNILLANACKFTLKGTITLSVKHRRDQLLVCVSDTGVGIAPEEQARIFKPFQKLDQSRVYNAGTGLSLAIAHWIVTAHGGTLTVESAVGEGAAFFVTLPIQSSVLDAVSPA